MEVSYEQLIQELVNARQGRDNSTWQEAAIIYVLRQHLGATAKQIAADIGYSSAYVSRMSKTYGAFPDEDSRALDLTYSHHELAAGTSDPAYWIDAAVNNAWSVREMKLAITGEPDDNQLKRAQGLWTNLLKFIACGGEGAAWLEEQIRGYV